MAFDDDAEIRTPLRLDATADAHGQAVITTDPVDIGLRWLLDYLVVSALNSPGCSASVFVDVADPLHLIDGTTAAAGAVASYLPPRMLGPGQQLIAVWAGCTPGDTVVLRVEYRTLDA